MKRFTLIVFTIILNIYWLNKIPLWSEKKNPIIIVHNVA